MSKKKLKSILFWAFGGLLVAAVFALACVSVASAFTVGTMAEEETTTAVMYIAADKNSKSAPSEIIIDRQNTDTTKEIYAFNVPKNTAKISSYLTITDSSINLDEIGLSINESRTFDDSDTTYQITLNVKAKSTRVAGGLGGFDIKITAGDSAKTTCSAHLRMSDPQTSFADQIKSLINTQGVLVSIFTICAIVLVRTELKVFRFGVKYKSNFVTVEDNDKFKEEMREESRATKADMQDSILKICLREIARDTKPVAEMQQLAQDLKTSKEMNDLQLKNMQAKYNEIQTLSSSLQNLEKTVRAIQYGETTTGERRSGK